MKFRHLPTEVEAVQLTEAKTIHTLNGTMNGLPGQWEVTGIKGEKYFVDPEIFAASYQAIEPEPAIEHEMIGGE